MDVGTRVFLAVWLANCQSLPVLDSPCQEMTDMDSEFLRTRNMARMTQSEVAERLGVSIASINRWERGKSRTPQTALMAMRQIAKTRYGDSYTLPGRI